jgi:hypothetical protein
MWINSEVYKRMARKRRFTSIHGYKGDRLIAGFAVYIGVDTPGDRSNGWLMFARDKPKEAQNND